MPKAKEACLRALELDDGLAEAYASLGFIKLHYDWDWSEAERAYRRALRLNANYHVAHSSYARFLNAMGRFDEAMEEAASAQRLDPLALGAATGLGLTHYFAGEYQRAIEQYTNVLKLDASFHPARYNLAAALAQAGRLDDARREYERVVESTPEDAGTLCELGYVYALSGRAEEARRIAERVNGLARQRYVSPPFIAWIHAALNDPATALGLVERGYEERSWPMIFLGVEPRYDRLRTQARFAKIVERMVLPSRRRRSA
jgi:tetratricopeptide (TPR) repeat protein